MVTRVQIFSHVMLGDEYALILGFGLGSAPCSAEADRRWKLATRLGRPPWAFADKLLESGALR